MEQVNEKMSPNIGQKSLLFSADTFNNESRKCIDYYAHTGRSMNPTLSYRDLLEIEPSNQVLIGDIILFRYKGKLIVHRIIDIAEEGIKTRGDNNEIEDFEFLTPQDIIGKVVAAWRGHKRRKIYGGLMGRLFILYIRTRRNLYRNTVPILTLIYYFIASWGILQWLISPFFIPKIVRFNCEGQNSLKLMMGSHVIGHYDCHLGCWKIYPPFLLFIRKATLSQEKIIV